MIGGWIGVGVVWVMDWGGGLGGGGLGWCVVLGAYVVHGSLTRPDPAPILRRRAVYGGWIGVGVVWVWCGVGVDCLPVLVSKCPIASPPAILPVPPALPPPFHPALTRAILEPKSCSISVTGNEWENGKWVVKTHSIYGAKMRRYCV